MNERPSVLVIGAGTLGFALAIILAKCGVLVAIYDANYKLMLDWVEYGYCPQYPWMKRYGKPKNLTLIATPTKELSVASYSFVILAVPMSALAYVLENLRDLHKAVLVTVQKGLSEDLKTPFRVVRNHFPDVELLQFTGAGFGKGIVAGHFTRMVIAHDGSYSSAVRFNDLFKGSKLWIRISQDPSVMCYGGVLRTITSCTLALVKKMFANKPETLAALMGGILAEYWRLLDILGGNHIADGSPEIKVLFSDLLLCELPSSVSRNTKFGHNLAKRMSVADALTDAAQNGVVESFLNLKAVHDLLLTKFSLEKIREDFVFLHYMYMMIWEGLPLDDCVNAIASRQNQPDPSIV